PEEFRLWIDEAADEPGGGDAIDPHALTSCPRTAAILLRLTAAHLVADRVWLIGREALVDSSLGIGQSSFDLGAGLAWKEISIRDRGHLAREYDVATPGLVLA